MPLLLFKAAAYSLFFTLLLIISIMDINKRTIPDKLIACICAIFGLYALILGVITLSVTNSLYAALMPFIRGIAGFTVIFIPLFALIMIADKLLKKPTMGGGDLKLLSVCGLFTGPQLALLFVLLFCLVTLAAFGVRAAALTHRPETTALKQRPKTAIKDISNDTQKKIPEASLPLGPYISIAAWLTLMFGERIMALF